MRGSSPERLPPGADPLAVDGFLFDMYQLFEDFVTLALSEALEEHGLAPRLQDPHHLDTTGLGRIRPDLVVRTRDGRTPVAVVDAKYKVERSRQPPQRRPVPGVGVRHGARSARGAPGVRARTAAHAFPRGTGGGGEDGRARSAAVPAQRRPLPRTGAAHVGPA
ncbi:hypothetical protein ACFVZC_01740 [Streptomyces marokkonensis]|uniref:Restriction endonuclease n=1 Tax=Streptomyces marokkonensis TaxID=324855 RepID=A0ABW6PYZ0_9ACTN